MPEDFLSSNETIFMNDTALSYDFIPKEIVHRENIPRYEALKWYFDRVGLDGDEVLTIVDNMPRLYSHTTV